MNKFKTTYYKQWKKRNSYQLRKLNSTDLSFSFDDLFVTSDHRKAEFLLESYSAKGIELALEKYGIIKYLKKVGFDKTRLVTDFNNPYKQRIALYNGLISSKTLLGELVIGKKSMKIENLSATNRQFFTFLAIEWLTLQNYRKQFSKAYPKLPGQIYPGLGLGRTILSVIYLMSWHLKFDAIFNIPEYYHNAAMYSEKFHFIDPDKEGLLRLIMNKYHNKLGMAVVSWIIEKGFMELDGQKFNWFTSPQIIPIARDLKKYFKSETYREQVQKAYDNYNISIRLNEFKSYLSKKPVAGFSEFLS